MTDKILVVEDEEKLRRLYEMELEEEGYEVVTAADGRGALEKLNKEPVDLVVLDLELSDGLGLGYLQEFMDIKRNVKVVINTAYPSYKMDFHSWAADAFLIKSSDLTELKQTIYNMLHSKGN
jgi:DNA-binding NtrC family response regulator